MRDESASSVVVEGAEVSRYGVRRDALSGVMGRIGGGFFSGCRMESSSKRRTGCSRVSFLERAKYSVFSGAFVQWMRIREL
jgi:hypothetical protein